MNHPFVNEDLLRQDKWRAPEIDRERKGDDTVDTVYHAVGQSLSGWEQLEEVLAWLFVTVSRATTAEQINILSRVFGAMHSSGQRRDVILEAAKAYFGSWWENDVVKSPMTSLLEAISAAARRRDEIAHGIASHYTVNGQKAGAFLLSAGYISSKNQFYGLLKQDIEADVLGYNTSIYRYTASDINYFTSRFAALKMYINFYSAAIAQHANGLPSNVFNALNSGEIQSNP